jgi:hypothetical protein
MSGRAASASASPGLLGRPSALVVAHPGHELTVHHWLERVRPRVFVLTDGSGSSGRSRLGSTTALLERLGAPRGGIYGRFGDRDLYAALRERRIEPWLALASELRSAFEADGVELVVADAAEGYNPSHDLAGRLAAAAARRASRATARPIEVFEIDVASGPGTAAPPAASLALDDAALERKRRAAGAYEELRGEVERALEERPVEAFRVEVFHRPGSDPAWRRTGGRPEYERVGEERVARGLYPEVIRHREHLAPIEEALERFGRG